MPVKSTRFESNVDLFSKALDEKVEQWLEAIGLDAASTAAGKAPVDTGRLKNSISYATPNSQGGQNTHGGETPAEPEDYATQGKPEERTVYIGTNVEYAPFHEYGTSKGIIGRHFLQFGATAHQQEYVQMLEEKLKE